MTSCSAFSPTRGPHIKETINVSSNSSLSNSAITELGYIGVEVSDRARWEAYAHDVLGMMVADSPAADVSWLRTDDRACRIILSDGSADDLAFAGWRVADTDALDAFGQHLDAIGIAHTAGDEGELARRCADRMLHFTDPTGTRHEVYCGDGAATAPFESAAVPGGFVTGAGGLGHIVLAANDYAASLAFVQDVIGMIPSDFVQIEPAPGFTIDFAFLHVNPRHHSLALAAVPGAPKVMHHFMVEVNNVTEVGLARDRNLAFGLPVQMDIGQHPNDKMISFYGETPSGFLVEFGCGGQLVGDGWQTDTYAEISTWGHRPAPAPV
jgi:biphenyl-2,3-diol 1,2-dioxygenase